MESNTSNSETNNLGSNNSNLEIGLPLLLVIPEYFNLFFLLAAVLLMYQGVEISHPLYFILFVNLVIPLSASINNICAYKIITTEKYFMMASFLNGFCLEFHCNCWFVTSILRYIYIFNENCIHNKIPNIKHQCIVALVATLVFLVTLMAPSIVYSISIGNLIFSYKCLLLERGFHI